MYMYVGVDSVTFMIICDSYSLVDQYRIAGKILYANRQRLIYRDLMAGNIDMQNMLLD